MEKYYGSYGFYKEDFNKRNYNEILIINTIMDVTEFLLKKGYSDNLAHYKESFRFDNISEADIDQVRVIIESNENSRKFDSKNMRKFGKDIITISSGDFSGELTKPYVYISM